VGDLHQLYKKEQTKGGHGSREEREGGEKKRSPVNTEIMGGGPHEVPEGAEKSEVTIDGPNGSGLVRRKIRERVSVGRKPNGVWGKCAA